MVIMKVMSLKVEDSEEEIILLKQVAKHRDQFNI